MRLVLLLLCSIVLLGACKQRKKTKLSRREEVIRNWNETIPGNFSAQAEVFFDSTRVDDFLQRYPEFGRDSAEIRKFYAGRKYAYAWFEGDTLIEQAGNLANRVANLELEGVSRTAPYQHQLDSLRENLRVSSQRRPDTELELMLTAQYFVFSRLAWDGVDVSVSKKASWFLPRKKIAYDAYLDSLLKKPSSSLFSDGPVYRQYELLKSYLQKYRSLEAAGDWPLIGTAKVLKPGDSAEAIGLIRKRLFVLEDLKGDTSKRTYDNELLAAVQQFQARHGLETSGTIGRQTIAELNVAPGRRVRQILVNMERSRWMPVSLKGDYLGVNIPEFRLHVYHADSLLWSANVVVGQTMHQTTVFYGEVQYIVFSPYWNVPPGILKQEILPAMKNDRNYLQKHRMEIAGYQGGVPVVRQLPGPENSLGLVKFMFPNSYDIYLHDTPSKSLFGESSRAFSHGCIRVGEPARLASFLLRDTVLWSDRKISAAMNAGREKYVTLKDKVPVFIAYFTAFVDRSNRLNFRNDIYKLDDRLGNLLF